MAQYQKNFYGTSYYGETNAYTGVYETNNIFTDEPLTGSFSINIQSTLPSANYQFSDPEIEEISGSWVESGGRVETDVSGAELLAKITCDRIRIHYVGNINSTSNVNVEVTTKEPGVAPVVTTYAFDPSSNEGEAYYEIDGLTYAPQEIRIYLDSTNASGATFIFDYIEARVTSFTIESRAKTDEGLWSAYEKLSPTFTEISANTYTVTADTISYNANNIVQVRLILATSDNLLSPSIDSLITQSGNTQNRTEDGSWEAIVDMGSLATSLGVTFARVLRFSWNATVPEKTKLHIRSAHSADGNLWSALSTPYSTSSHRLRLKDGKTTGYVTTPVIDPSSRSEFLRINQWQKWEDVSYLPPDRTSTGITYYFLDEKNNVIHRIDNPQDITDKNLSHLGNKTFRVRIELKKRFDKSSPVVDEVNLFSHLTYEENKHISDRDASVVDNQNTGKKIAFSLDEVIFMPPTEVTDPSYILLDETSRPEGVRQEDLLLYYDSEKELITRTNKTQNATEKVWVELKGRNANQPNGVLKHYQYGGGLSYYQNLDEVSLASSFTPSLKGEKSYRYYLQSGWPTRYHQVGGQETLNEIALIYGKTQEEIQSVNPNLQTREDGTLVPQQILEIPNDSVNSNVLLYWKSEEDGDPNLRTNITEKSAHNAIVQNLSSHENDQIVARVTQTSAKGLVEWVSDEKIYSGRLNLNNQYSHYIREHRTPESGDSLDMMYTPTNGETYKSIADKFGVDANDIREINQIPAGEEVISGREILIPSRIVLPKIDPMVQIGSNPYEIEIVYNSVRRKEEVMDEGLIDDISLDVIEEDVIVTKEEITRGSVPNTHDVLSNPKVIEILGVWDTIDDPVAAPSYINGTHYQLVGNNIDWSLTPGGTYEEPAVGATYYVSYRCKKPVAVRVNIGSSYKELSGTDQLWRSPEVKEFEGQVDVKELADGTYHWMDYRAELPDPLEWKNSQDPTVSDFEYVIEDTDLWVKTRVEHNEETGKAEVVASLEGRIPKDNWFPSIHTGYYYIGKDEYYLFSEIKKESFGEAHIPIARQVSYVDGKYSKGAQLEKASSNLIRNSGFEKATNQTTVMQITF